MRVCIFGPPGAGKTTFASILHRVLSSRLDLVHGDDFVRQDFSDLDGLDHRLSRAKSFIFEHVSAPGILRALKIKPDIAICLAYSYRLDPKGFSSDPAHHDKQEQFTLDLGCSLLKASNTREALALSLPFLQKAGLFPNPVANFVIKVAAKCNLNCSYCYMYQALDQNWKDAPSFMSFSVAKQLGYRLAEHSERYPRLKIAAIIHGGEPLVLGPEVLRKLIGAIGKDTSRAQVSFTVQTNGTLITPDYLDVLDDIGLHIGISVDGSTMVANRHRVHHSGAPAHTEILRGIEACLNYDFRNGEFGGVLCVVDPAADGRKTYHQLRGMGLKGFDFLLRDENHVSAPGGRTTGRSAASFLCDAFDAWLVDPEPCDVRLFQALVAQSIGANYSTDAVGLHPMDELAVSTAGSWELLDILRTSFPDAWKLPYTVFDSSVAEVVSSSQYQRALEWQYDLADQCLRCDHLLACGGGYLPHRYSPEASFRNPSVHCDALYRVIEHIKRRLNVKSAVPS